MERKRDTAVFHLISGSVWLFKKMTFESPKNTTVSATSVCLAVSTVMSQTRQVRVANISNTSRTNLFLLFISKEWSNTAALWAQIWSKKKKKEDLFGMNIDRFTKLSLQMEIFAYFLRFRISLHRRLLSPLTTRFVCFFLSFFPKSPLI